MPGWVCALGWAGAAVVFIALARRIGPLSANDSELSLVPAAAVAHGAWACAYAPHPAATNLAAPFFALADGAIQAALRLGHAVPFPAGAALGHDCATAFVPEQRWVFNPATTAALLRTGYLMWGALLAGAVAVVRAFGRGRTRWELVTVGVVAVTVPAALALVEVFHPEDLLCVGLCLIGLALLRRERWMAAGAVFGLALLTQQFAILALVPAAFAVPPNHRREALVGLGAVVVVLLGAFALVTDGRVLGDLSGVNDTVLASSTWLTQVHVTHGAPLFVLSRLVPIIVAAAVAALALRRLGLAAFSGVALLDVVALGFCARLVFEANLYGYYFAATAVTLVVADAVRGRVRPTVLAWIGLVAWCYVPALAPGPPGFGSLPYWVRGDVVVALALLLTIVPLWRPLALGRSRAIESAPTG